MKSLSLFTVDKKTKTLVAEISTLNGFDFQADQQAIKLVGDRVTNWYISSTDKTVDGDISSWTLKLSPLDISAYPECKKWQMVIFNS